ncbi:MAG TPA: DUF6448 family protein [Vicinamibacteria bacterium]|nr:DUF6448 family protein [Vicinamibacteria bacterium]
MKGALPRILLAAAMAAVPARALAHCDTLDGPVVRDARTALESRDVRPALKWVGPDREAEVREAFARAAAVREAGPESRELADLYFFETVVRVHREGEGAAFTGLKPAGTAVEPAILASDQALAEGSVEALVALLRQGMESGLRERFARVLKARRHADDSIEGGRAFVAAYVEFVHYAERLDLDASRPASHERGAHEH